MITNRQDIRHWLTANGIKSCQIDDEGQVSSYDSVIIKNPSLVELPIQFKEIRNGNFDVSQCSKLASLRGLPKYVGANLFLDGTKISSLSGIEKVVQEVYGQIHVNTSATNILGLVLIKGVTTIVFELDWLKEASERMHTLRIITSRHLGTGDILAFQDELLDAGFLGQARL